MLCIVYLLYYVNKHQEKNNQLCIQSCNIVCIDTIVTRVPHTNSWSDDGA